MYLVYVIGNGLYKRSIYGWFPLSHWTGLGLFAIVAPFAFRTDLPDRGRAHDGRNDRRRRMESVSRRSMERERELGIE